MEISPGSPKNANAQSVPFLAEAGQILVYSVNPWELMNRILRLPEIDMQMERDSCG
jgi:hypothetical protein